MLVMHFIHADRVVAGPFAVIQALAQRERSLVKRSTNRHKPSNDHGAIYALQKTWHVTKLSNYRCWFSTAARRLRIETFISRVIFNPLAWRENLSSSFREKRPPARLGAPSQYQHLCIFSRGTS